MKKHLLALVAILLMVTSLSFAGETQNMTPDIKDSDLVPFEENGLYGFTYAFSYNNANLDINHIETEYDDAEPFQEGVSIVQKNGKFGLIDKDNILLAPFEYDTIFEFENGIAYARKGDYYGLLSNKGEEIVPFVHEHNIYYKVGSYFEMILEGKHGLYDRNGNTVIPFEYVDLKELNEGYIIFVDEMNRHGYLDLDGNVVIEALYSNASVFREGRAVVQNASFQSAVIDTKGNKISNFTSDLLGTYLQNQYYSQPYSPERLYGFYGGMASLKRGNKYGAINADGDMTVQPIYDYISPFYEGAAVVKLNNLYGLINTQGKVIVPIEYRNIYSFYDGLAVAVNSVQQYNYLLPDGSFLLDAFQLREPSYEDQIIGEKDGKYGCYNKDGSVAIPFDYTSLGKVGDYYRVSQNGKFGLIDKEGHIVVALNYENVFPPQYGLFNVIQGGKQGLLNASGEFVMEPLYDRIGLGVMGGRI